MTDCLYAYSRAHGTRVQCEQRSHLISMNVSFALVRWLCRSVRQCIRRHVPSACCAVKSPFLAATVSMTILHPCSTTREPILAQQPAKVLRVRADGCGTQAAHLPALRRMWEDVGGWVIGPGVLSSTASQAWSWDLGCTTGSNRGLLSHHAHSEELPAFLFAFCLSHKELVSWLHLTEKSRSGVSLLEPFG
jgi:hypothetical protein